MNFSIKDEFDNMWECDVAYTKNPFGGDTNTCESLKQYIQWKNIP